MLFGGTCWPRSPRMLKLEQRQLILESNCWLDAWPLATVSCGRRKSPEIYQFLFFSISGFAMTGTRLLHLIMEAHHMSFTTTGFVRALLTKWPWPGRFVIMGCSSLIRENSILCVLLISGRNIFAFYRLRFHLWQTRLSLHRLRCFI